MKKTTRIISILLVVTLAVGIFPIAASAADSKASAFATKPSGGCGCACHTNPGMIHTTPCCSPIKSFETIALEAACDKLGSDFDITEILKFYIADSGIARDIHEYAKDATEALRASPNDPNVISVADFINDLAAISQGKQVNSKMTLGQLLEVSESISDLENFDPVMLLSIPWREIIRIIILILEMILSLLG